MRAGVLVAILALAACGHEDDRPASWKYISVTIVQPSCATAGCHSKLTGTAGLRLEDPVATYTYFVGGGLVVPGQPDQSRLMYLLRGDEVVKRMPPDGPLPDADIELIERWILEGAVDN